MNNKPLLSILIPTKNREESAQKVIHYVLGINDNRLEIVVQDNSDTDILKNLLSDCLSDQRLKYFYNNDILSFVDNFSFGIDKCNGEYVTIIGDDDWINPLIIEIADLAYKNGIKAITPSLPVIYYWPLSGVNSEKGKGRLTIQDISCKVKFCKPQNEIINLLRNGCLNYLSFNLVKAYHGLIRKSILDEIKDRTGNFIGGLSPDIYLSVAASLIVEKVLVIDYPLTISGICKRSGSADSATGRHTGNLDQAPHFRGHNNYEWSNRVPLFYSVETIWADSALAAIKDLKFTNLIKHFNLNVLSVYCLKSYPQFKTFIFENLTRTFNISKRSISMDFHLLNGFIYGPFFILARKIKNRLLGKNIVSIYQDVPDIEKASEIIQENIENNNKLILKNIQNIN